MPQRFSVFLKGFAKAVSECRRPPFPVPFFSFGIADDPRHLVPGVENRGIRAVEGSPSRLIRVFPEPALMEVLISQRLRRQLENHASVRTYNCFSILSVSSEVFQITAAPNSFHYRKQHHHNLRTDYFSILIHCINAVLSLLLSNTFSYIYHLCNKY